MAKLTITLTEDMLKLISCIQFTELDGSALIDNDLSEYGFDLKCLYGCDVTFENISYILGRYNEHIQGTEERLCGAQFPPEVEDYFWATHSYIIEHFREIEEIIHQFVTKGGISVGTYTCNGYDRIWEKE